MENNLKPSKTKALLIFSGLIAGAVLSVAGLKYSAEHLVDEKALGSELVKMQKNNHEVFGQNEANITKALFDKFPEAQAMLIGSLYITGDTFKLFVRPTTLPVDKQKPIDTYALDNDGLAIFEVNGVFKNGIASNYTIRPWHPELEKKDDTWSWSIDSVLHKAFMGFLYVFPGMETIDTASKNMAYSFVKVGTENLPFAVYNRPKDDGSSSAMFEAKTVNAVRLQKSSLPGSPLAIRSDEIGCVFTVWPEYIKDGRFRLEAKDVACIDAEKASKIKGVSVIGEEGKYGVLAFEENGTFVIDQGRSITVFAKKTK